MTKRYKLTEASIAAGLHAGSVNTLIKRGKIQLADDVFDGRARTFSFDEVVQLALMERMMRFGMDRERAWQFTIPFSEAGDFAVPGDKTVRGPGELYAQGQTLLVIDHRAENARLMNFAPGRPLSDIMGEAPVALIIDVGMVVETVKNRMATIEALDAA